MAGRPRARFSQVNVVVADMDRSLAFYRVLGAGIADMPAPWDAHHRTVTGVSAEVTMELDSSVSVPNWASGWSGDRVGVIVGFLVGAGEEVDALAGEIASAGHRVLQAPHDAFFGARYAVVEDPDGNAIGIMGPVDEARRWMPDVPD